MAGSLLPLAKQIALTDAAAPGVGYQFFTYEPGTLTEKVTYSDAALSTPNANPVIANARGEVVMYGTGLYRIILKDADGVTKWDRDNVGGASASVDIFAALLAASSGSSLVGFLQSGVDATARTVQAKLRDVVSIKDFGAVGDYDTDDTAAVVAWIAYLSSSGKTGYAPAGVYHCTDNIVLPERVKIVGDGAPAIATFPQYGGDKSLLRPGYKDQISGTVFIFSGTPTNTFTTTRADRFASIAPCMLYDHYAPPILRDFAIIQDMDVLDAGGSLTTAATDNRATGYTAGLVTKCTQALIDDVTIFGYFGDAGMVIVNKDGDSTADPDYNRLSNALVSSGLAIIGMDSTAVSEGLTGTLAHGCGFYGADHHERAATDPDVPCLYIDGNLTSGGEIRGHTFTGCNFRALANDAIVFDHCDDVALVGCVTEFSLVAGVSGLDANGHIVGTANTQNVRLLAVASTHDMGVATLAATISGKFQFVGAGGTNDAAYFGEAGKGVAILGDSNTGDSIIQLTDDFSTSTAQWTIRRDDDVSDLLDIRWNNASVFSIDTTGAIGRLALRSGSLTIASGAVTIGSLSYYSVDTEGAAATDDLDTISGGITGQILVLRAANSGRDVVVTEAGNIRLNAAGAFTLTHAQDRITLMYDGAAWIEISRSDNTA